MRWQLQQAKQRFSALVQRALDEGPQVVTRHGEEVVVVVSSKEFARLKGETRDFRDFLRAAPTSMPSTSSAPPTKHACSPECSQPPACDRRTAGRNSDCHGADPGHTEHGRRSANGRPSVESVHTRAPRRARADASEVYRAWIFSSIAFQNWPTVILATPLSMRWPTAATAPPT